MEDTHREDFVNQHADQSEKTGHTGDSLIEGQSAGVNTKPYPCTVKASSTTEHGSASIAEDESSQNQGSFDNIEKMSDATMAGLEDMVVSYMHLSEETTSIFKDISHTTVADSQHPTSCSVEIDHSATDETMISILKDVSGTNQITSSFDRKHKTSTEKFKQPPRKKIKLSKSVKIPVRDVLTGVHTKLCKCDCQRKHNPLVLAICAPDDYKLKNCLENHLKLAMKGAWSLDPRLISRLHHLVILAMLFGKCDLLKGLLKLCPDHSKFYLDSAQNSPLHTVMTCLHQYMPSSSYHEKVVTFQHMLQILAKYSCKILLVRDKANGDTILHLCAKKIRKLTNQMKAVESLDASKLQGLLNQRQLFEGIFKDMIHTFKQLCTDGSLLHSQVIELFDCVNKAGETMSQILQDDELARNNSGIVANPVATTVSKEGNTECAKQQIRDAGENCEDAMTEVSTAQLNTVTKTAGTCTTQNANAYVSTQAANPFGSASYPTKHLSVQATVSAPMRSTQSIVSVQAGNSKGTITLQTNCPSALAPNRNQNYKVSSKVSASLWVPPVVVLAQEPHPVPPPALAPERCQTHNVSTTVSASQTVVSPQTVVSTQARNSTGTIALSANSPSAQAPNERPNQSTSTTVSISARMSQTVVSNQAGNSSGTIILPTNSLSAQAPNEWPNQSTSTTVSTSVRIPQTVVSNQAGNSLRTITLPNNSPSAQALNGWPNQSTLTNAPASVKMPQGVVSTQTGNSTVTVALPINSPSVLTFNECQNHNASTTVSSSLWALQAAVSTQVRNSSRAIALPTNFSSGQAPNEWPNQSTSTIVSTSVRMPQTVLSNQAGNSSGTITLPTNSLSAQAPSGWPKQSTSTTVSTSVKIPQGVVSTIVPTQVATLCGTTTILSNHSSVEESRECPNQSTLTTVSVTESALCQSADTRGPVTETLTHCSDMPTIQLTTEGQQSGKHTFLCSHNCSLTHHKLVQLICATPDHLSTDIATVEMETCAKLRDYLNKTHWDMSSVVPALMPCLRLPVVHLACLLGKHRALEVFSEFRFHPLIHTAETEETPLHMTMQLLRHQTSASIFLSDVMVSIFKTLNRHSHAISLFSAKDKKGNSVLHAMAELISSNVPESAALLYVYLFRVFVHFLLKGQQNIPESESLQILSSCLKDCNKLGEDVESILQKSIPGQHLLEYLGGLMQSRMQLTSAGTLVAATSDNFGGQETQHVMSTVQVHDVPRVEVGVHVMCKEPESLVDFILSAECKISSASKTRIVECYTAEYHNKLQQIRTKVESVKGELVSAEMLQLQNVTSRDELRRIKTELKWNAKILILKKRELREKQKKQLKEKRKEQELLHKRLQLIEALSQTLDKLVS